MKKWMMIVAMTWSCGAMAAIDNEDCQTQAANYVHDNISGEILEMRQLGPAGEADRHIEIWVKTLDCGSFSLHYSSSCLLTPRVWPVPSCLVEGRR